MSSRLFIEIREKRGLAYSISCSSKILQDTGLFLIRAGVDNQKIVETLSLILKELNKITRHGVGLSEFKRGREYLLGQLQLSLEDTMEHMLWVGESVMTKNKVKTMKGILKEFNRIKPADIKRVAGEILNPKRYRLAIVGPVTPKQEEQMKRLIGAQ